MNKFHPIIRWLGSLGLLISALVCLILSQLTDINIWYLAIPLFAAAVWQIVFWDRI